MDEANRLVKEFASHGEGVAFLDTSTPMLDAAGNPRPEYLPWYRLHLTAKGYGLWASGIKPILEADLGPAAAGRGTAARGAAPDRGA
jgi:lysophospholipase L1-like esterase